MTQFEAMENFFFSIFEELPSFLMSEPIIYFISIAIAIYVAALMVTLINHNRRY